jgi:hypothetical protein
MRTIRIGKAKMSTPAVVDVGAVRKRRRISAEFPIRKFPRSRDAE